MKIKKVIAMSSIVLVFCFLFMSCKMPSKEVTKEVEEGDNTEIPIIEILIPDESTKETISEIVYEDWVGEVPHIFIHGLIAYPELKSGDGNMRYDGVCINVAEWKSMLNELYLNGYSLVDIHNTFGKDENGKLKFYKSVKVPVGRKPVIISVDDIVYDYKKRGNGMVDMLALDENNNVVAGTIAKDGSISYSDDNEFVPILERFINEHPDFSSNNARMVFGMTGFAGTFGYRTDLNYTGDRQAEIVNAKAVADRLKELGYTFASHGYGHRNVNKHSVASMKHDLQRWKDEVVPIVGDVSVYIYPYGKLVYPKDERYKEAQSYGMNLFCSVSHEFFQRNYSSGDTLYQQRVAIDGYSLRNYAKTLAPLFDVNKVIDKENRK